MSKMICSVSAWVYPIMPVPLVAAADSFGRIMPTILILTPPPAIAVFIYAASSDLSSQTPFSSLYVNLSEAVITVKLLPIISEYSISFVKSSAFTPSIASLSLRIISF